MLYYFIDAQGEHHGPYKLNYFKHHPINSRTWVWHKGLPMWVEAYSVPSLRRYLDATSPRSFTEYSGDLDLSKEKYNTPHAMVLSSDAREQLRSNVPKTWMVESVLVTLFCCLPFGVIGLIYASRVTSYWRQGLYGESVESSVMAGMWVKISFFASIILWLIYVAIYFFTPVGDRTIMWYNNYMIN